MWQEWSIIITSKHGILQRGRNTKSRKTDKDMEGNGKTRLHRKLHENGNGTEHHQRPKKMDPSYACMPHQRNLTEEMKEEEKEYLTCAEVYIYLSV